MGNVTTDFNVNPYYDDYDQDKGFLRILFRPGYAVQGRELTQLQTILQKQVSRFGDHIFKDGSKVLGGELTLDTEVKYLKLSTGAVASEFENGIINDSSATIGTGTTRAQVIATINEIGSDVPTLILKYISGSSFSAGSTIYLEGSTTTATVNATLPTGNSSIVSINRGIYFVNGFFVLVEPQTLVLNKYDNIPTNRIGLLTTESIVESSTDLSLLDPASGTTNANAPGATRFKINLTLSKKDTTSTDPVLANADSNFIELMRVENGVPTRHTKYPVYGEIEKTLARRTYDESGDYTIKPFPVQIVDHKGATGTTLASTDTTITGVLTDFQNDFAVGDNIRLSSGTATANITSITNATSMTINTALGDGTSQTIFNNNRVSAALEPGKAYVKGYEYESIGVEYVDIKKGRDTSTTTSLPINPNFGHSLKVTGVDFGASTNGNVFDPSNLSQSYDLHCVSKETISDTNQNKYNSTKIGTTKIRQFDYSSGSFANTEVSNTAIFDAYIFDTQLTPITLKVGSTYTSGATSIVLQSTKRSGQDDAYNGAKLTLGSETREITDYDSGTGTATINLAFSTSATTTDDLTINFSSREIESLAIANSTGYGIANTVLMNIDNSSKANVNDNTSNTLIQDTNLNSLVFPIGIDNVKSHNSQGISYQAKHVINTVNFALSGTTVQATITDLPAGFIYETEGKQTGQLEAPKTNFIVVAESDASNLIADSDTTNAGAGTALTSGNPYFIGEGEIVECDISVTTTSSLTLTAKRYGANTYNTFKSGSFSARVYATVDTVSAGKNEKVKTKTVSTTLVTAGDIGSSGKLLDGAGSGTGTNCTPAELDARLTAGHSVQAPFTGTSSLGVADVIEVTNVVEALASGTTAALQFAGIQDVVGNTAHINNITSRYTFNNGQKDNFYDHASITLKPGETPPANNIIITFDYFTHTPTDGYASVESYSGVTYEQIPAFISPITGVRKELRDCIDFRPVKGIANGASGSGVIQDNDFIPDADVSLTANVISYMGRKDKLALTKDRVFSVIQGVSSDDPILPADDEDSMTLYNLDIPPFTFNPSDVDTQYIDNRRFTMRDIGKIEKRVDSLEYYTALSLLEKEASDLSIKDSATGTERFKNGILVDSFNGHNIGDVSNEDFKAAIDFEMKELRPSYYSDSYKFSHDASGSSANTTKTGDLVTLNYSSSNLVVQPLASNTESLNPFGTNQFNGQLTLTPPSDVWFSDAGRPLVLINLEGLNDHWVQGNDNGFGKQWDDWSFTWSGSQINDDNLIKNRKISATSNAISRFANLTEKNKTRTGIVSTKPPETIKRSVGNRTVSVSIVPFIRTQRVQFVAKGVKPNSTFYPYFDNTLATANTKPAYALTYTTDSTSANSGVFNTNAGEQVTLIQRNVVGVNTVNTTAIALYQNSSTILVSDLIQEVSLSPSVPSGLSVGERVTFTNGTSTVVSTLQSFDTSKNTLTVNSISGTLDTSYNTIEGSVTGNISGTVTHAGAFTTGEVFTGVGSAKANVNVSGIGSVIPTYGGTITSDKNGVIAGELTIPENTHRVGERLFRLTDSSTDTILSTESVAEKMFRVQGLQETRSGRISSTRPLEPKRENVKEKNVTQDTINRISTSTNWINPLTQTFLVDRSLHENGVFINSVDIFFSSVDTILPVTLQIRPVVNGAPSSSQILPFAEVTLNGSEVNVSATAPSLATSSTYTTFTFESPVYLYPDEYAIVLTSPSENYSVHVAKIGEVVRNTTDTNVSQQPFVESFYEPQNSSVWLPTAEKQMMFRVNRCEFNTGSHSAYFSLNSNPLSGNTSGIEYDVFKLSTSELNFSNTSINYSYKGIPQTSTVASEDNRSAQIDASFNNFSANRNIILGSQNKILSPIDSVGQVSYSANNYYLRSVLTSNDSKISPVIDISRLNLITVENEINRGSFTNSDVVVTSSGTGYTNGAFSITGTGGSSANVTIVTDGSGVITSAYISSAGSGYYEDASVTLTGGTNGTISIQNELNPDGGNAKTRYISRRVTLEDGFDAQDLKVFINAYKPKNTDIKVYYKVHSLEDPEDFEDKPYVLFTQETDLNLISASESDIKEYVFRTSANNISYTSGTQTYDNFKTFSIKIVLGSSSTAIIPKVKDMKAIALDF